MTRAFRRISHFGVVVVLLVDVGDDTGSPRVRSSTITAALVTTMAVLAMLTAALARFLCFSQFRDVVVDDVVVVVVVVVVVFGVAESFVQFAQPAAVVGRVITTTTITTTRPERSARKTETETRAGGTRAQHTRLQTHNTLQTDTHENKIN